VKSYGDKIYKVPEHSTDFFKPGGLIVGSTNHSHLKSVGNPKVIDFYANLDLTKANMSKGKTWKKAVEEERLNSEMTDVTALREWEKTVLREADPKFNPDSDVEETQEDRDRRIAEQEARKNTDAKKAPPAAAKKK
jgi:hypothetical protein